MRNFRTIFTVLLAGAFFVSVERPAIADAGDRVSGGGQILEDPPGHKISFGLWANDLGGGILEGEFQINFHRVGVPGLDKAKFHGSDVTFMLVVPGDDLSCNAATRIRVNGTLDGVPGYAVQLRAGDAGSPGNTNAAEPFDTARFELFDNGMLIYDTTAPPPDGFADQSNCVGQARTGVDRGNLTITLD